MSEVLLIGLIIAFVIYRIFSPKLKGSIGELKVAWRLKRLNNYEYKVFNDVLIKTGSRSSQIDHIVVSIHGIFVIETKNYGGWIHGHEKSEYWVQSFYKKKNKFRNPVIQSWGHISTLKDVLSGYDHILYHPIIVFSGAAKLKNVYSEVPVIYRRQLLRTIMNEKKTINLTSEQVKRIAEKINKASIHGKKARKEHARRARKNTYEQKRKENLLVCPKCGGRLIIRQGQFGHFYGCPNFPNCNYTKKI